MNMTNTFFADIETNAIENWSTLEDLETIHCICALDQDDKEYRWSTDAGNIDEGIQALTNCENLVFHNGVSFDYPALAKHTGFRHNNVADTLVMSRCIYPDLKRDDHRAGRNTKIVGSHSLKAWGERLGFHKGDFGEDTDWSTWSIEMEDYCLQDCRVTKKLFDHLISKEPSKNMLSLEHRFASLMRRQEFYGFPFNVDAAEKLAADLCVKRVELRDRLEKVFEPTVVPMKSFWYVNAAGDKFPSKKAMKEVGYKDDQILKGERKTKTIPFNPGSRDQISERLMAKGWKPAAYEGKRPQINEGVLKQIGSEESEALLEYLTVQKRLGQLAEGKQAWLSLEKKGKIHGQVLTNGTISGRASHRNPNVAQVPGVGSPYGAECRALFTPLEGSVLVGADASGLELRCLAHYLAAFDGGRYAEIVVDGDIHTANQKAAGLEERSQAKTMAYALIYGAGNEKLGQIIGGGSKAGKALREKFINNTPGIKKLFDAVDNAVKTRGSLVGLDGRILPCRSPHSALNLLLQSAGAVIMKMTSIQFNELARHPHTLHAHVHDEIQFSCREEHAEELGNTFIEAIKTTEKILGFNCPLDGEFKIGSNWKETH